MAHKSTNAWSILLIAAGILLIGGVFFLTDYAFKKWGDNAAAFLWVMPPYCFGMFGALFGGGGLALFGLLRLTILAKK